MPALWMILATRAWLERGKRWNAGVVGMRPGGKRLLLLPPAMAYGARSIEDAVPADAATMFRIELIRLENPSGS